MKKLKCECPKKGEVKLIASYSGTAREVRAYIDYLIARAGINIRYFEKIKVVDNLIRKKETKK